MKSTFVATRFGLALLALINAAAVYAHQIWIEQSPGQDAVIRFGEFGENLREASPGLLDKFVKPQATLLSSRGEKKADASKTPTGLALPFRAARGDTIVAEDASYPLYTWKQGDKEITNWYHPAARYLTAFTAQEPRLPLDLVPTGKVGEFKLYFKGKPLPKVKVNLLVQSGWAKEARTDEQGLVKFDMPWKGTYVAEVSHTDRTAGERPGAQGTEKFDGVSYATTVTYVKAAGLAALPPPPAAKPAPAPAK